jgi:hypothetical protein
LGRLLEAASERAEREALLDSVQVLLAAAAFGQQSRRELGGELALEGVD